MNFDYLGPIDFALGLATPGGLRSGSAPAHLVIFIFTHTFVSVKGVYLGRDWYDVRACLYPFLMLNISESNKLW